MPRVYKRKLGARNYREYSDEDLQAAIDLIKNGKLTSYGAAERFNIPRRTLDNKVKGLHTGTVGTPTQLSADEEQKFVDVMLASAEYGCPLSMMELRMIVADYLKKCGRTAVFGGNPPGVDWCMSFLKRHKDVLTQRSCQNINRSRAMKSDTEMEDYFKNLKVSLENVPCANILNYDETNVTDNPGSKKCVFRRGVKYPERVMNNTKTAISLMFAISASGESLPVYIVYKSEQKWRQWCEGGPPKSRYNNTKSGWFDTATFEDWFANIVVPWARRKSGPKVVIGDNLASHLNPSVLTLCKDHNIRFVFLPPNSTHLTQPLDVAYFRPLKREWRKILTDYKLCHPKESSLNKCAFPKLLAKLMDNISIKGVNNIVSGFRTCGIYPFNPEEVLKKLPRKDLPESDIGQIDQSLLAFLKEVRSPPAATGHQRRKKLKVPSGASVTYEDIAEVEDRPEAEDGSGAEDGQVASGSGSAINVIEDDTHDSDSDQEVSTPLLNPPSSVVGRPIQCNDWVIVKLSGKRTYKHYAAFVVATEEDECTVRFMKSVIPTKFSFSNEADSVVSSADVVAVLELPVIDRRQLYSFPNDMSMFKFMS